MENDAKKIAEQRLLSFKKALKDMIATSKTAYQKTNNRQVREIDPYYTRETIERIVAQGSAEERAALSEHYFKKSGLYKRIILHYATFLTYSWILVPHMKNRKDKISNKKIANFYYESADFCANFQIERKCTLFAKAIFVKGAYYGLIHDNKDYVAIQDLPFEYCRSRFKNQQDIDIVEFDMRFFDTIREEDLRKEILSTYPKVVQKGYYNYKIKDKNPWIFLPAEMGIYFNFFDERPFFLDLIPDLDDLDDYRVIDKKRNVQALKKILVQQVLVDGDKLVFEPDEAEEMHAGALNMLEDNTDVDVITTYNKVDLLDLSSDDDEKTEVQTVRDSIYESAGISKELFSATTDAGLEFSLDNDLAMCMILGHKFAHFFTALLNNKFSNSKIKYKVLILPISYYNKEEYTSKAKDLAAFGYSFLTPILSTGLDQTSLADLKDLENDLLDFDVLLKPLQSAYTQSGKTNAITAQAGKTQQATEEKKTSSETKETKETTETEKKEDKGDKKTDDKKSEVKKDVTNSNK